MNRFFRICFLCVTGIIIFFSGMFFSSFLLVKKQEEAHERIEQIKYPKVISSEERSETVETAVIPVVDMNTEYVVIKENIITGETTESVEELPRQFSGMDREEIKSFFEEYQKCPTLEDREKGFVSASVEKYSVERLVIRKIYEPIELEERFYLRAEENYVVIYYADNRTVYMYTNICLDVLPDETKKQIEEGKMIETYESLYSFLESYTS